MVTRELNIASSVLENMILKTVKKLRLNVIIAILSRHVLEKGIDVVLVQDPYVSNKVALGIPSHWPFFYSFNYNAAIYLTNKDYTCIQ